jgi:transposase
MDELELELKAMLAGLPEVAFLQTMPGIGWRSAAGLVAHVGDISRFVHGRQLVKLAGLNPSRNDSGETSGRTSFTHRGRAGLRKVVYMATLSSLSHNPRIRAHYDRLRQRDQRPLSKMKALGACMTKFLLYAFAVMKQRVPFDCNHEWRAALAASRH